MIFVSISYRYYRKLCSACSFTILWCTRTCMLDINMCNLFDKREENENFHQVKVLQRTVLLKTSEISVRKLKYKIHFNKRLVTALLIQYTYELSFVKGFYETEQNLTSHQIQTFSLVKFIIRIYSIFWFVCSFFLSFDVTENRYTLHA